MTATSSQQQVADLYLEHHRWLQHWLQRRLSNTCDAPDLLQSTFEKVLRKPQALVQVREPRAWLLHIARHLVIDHQRRLALEQAYKDALAALPAGHAPDPAEGVEILQTLCALDALLHGMGPKVRTAFLLSRLHAQTHAEIAAQMGVSVSSVEKYLARALTHCVRRRQELGV